MESTSATIIGYKGLIFINGYVGAESSPKTGEKLRKTHLTPALINDPTKPGQIGFVCDASKLTMNEDAKKLLSTIKKSRDDIGDVDMFVADDGIPVFSWLGGPMQVINPAKAEGSSSYDLKVLDLIPVVSTEIPESIKNYSPPK